MATYKIDPTHSDITFKIKHLMISSVTGSFKKFDATFETNSADFTDATINFEADVNSIDTGNEQRDAHLKADDFFNAEQFPTLKFSSTNVEKESDEEYKVTGNLTVRDITKPVELKVDFNGTIVDPWGQERLGFEINGKINRKEFGLTWSALTEAGGLVLADDVKLNMNVEMVKQAQ
ncbi:polyisoprenoid-binding protein [Segetibacter sp. 3557_3]|uniref:YceI family protein n=1 Tax=Segetibacter sp. 3557_3 TaxID=2547429 RepID=UPI001058AF50|nr:YceI family protein [Segetibacter sp. 3557_3]TDH23993.1 polyisoprenoid-binding protein [Segetibacter sp. 3557_3]